VAIPIAILDACVLYPAPLRDLLMHLTLADLYKAKWTNAIHEEWITSALSIRSDLTRDQLERTRSLMDLHAEDCLVDDYESWIPRLALPDPADRHVLAAAIVSSASFIVTFNLKDFPEKQLVDYGIKATHPDDFVSELVDSLPMAAIKAVRRHHSSLKNPPKTIDQYLGTLKKQGMKKFVNKLKKVPYICEQDVFKVNP